MKVEQLMTRTVRSCGPYDSLSCPAQIMWESDVGCVPVVDHEGRVIGMITDRDIAMAAHLRGLKVDEMAVQDVMAREIQTCRPGESVTRAEERMQKFQVRRLPVTDAKGRLVGLLSLNDIAIEGAREKNTRKPEVAPGDVAATLAEICQHRRESSVLDAVAQ